MKAAEDHEHFCRPVKRVWVTGWAMPRAYYDSEDRIVLDADEPAVLAQQLNGVFEQYSGFALYVFAHSLGGFCLARALPLLSYFPESVTMVGVRLGYPARLCRVMQRSLKTDYWRVLEDFFSSAYPADHFLQRYREAIQNEWPLTRLQWGLDQLIAFQMPSVPITLIHARDDQIAPLDEARDLANKMAARWIELSHQAHIPVLSVVESRVIRPDG